MAVILRSSAYRFALRRRPPVLALGLVGHRLWHRAVLGTRLRLGLFWGTALANLVAQFSEAIEIAGRRRLYSLSNALHALH